MEKCEYQKILDLYHEILHMCPRVMILTKKRKDKIRARWAEYPDLEQWRSIFTCVATNPFLTGKVDPTPPYRRFFASLDWLTRNEDNIVKIIEGAYDDEK